MEKFTEYDGCTCEDCIVERLNEVVDRVTDLEAKLHAAEVERDAANATWRRLEEERRWKEEIDNA